MKEIEFRFFDQKEKKYNTFYPLAITENGNILWCTPNYGKWEKAPKVRFLPEQYTGFEDINKKKIFEGDVIKLGKDTYDDNYEPGEIVIVEWNEYIAGFKPFSNTHSDYNCIDTDTCEIIGNIHENKELIR